MTTDQLINLYTITIAIVAPVSGATIFGMTWAKQKSVGAKAVYKLMDQLNKMRSDLDQLKLSDKGKADEIKVLEEDIKELHLLIIELLKTK